MTPGATVRLVGDPTKLALVASLVCTESVIIPAYPETSYESSLSGQTRQAEHAENSTMYLGKRQTNEVWLHR